MSAPLLSLEGFGLDLCVDGDYRTVIHTVDLSVERGQAVGLVGESGSGKSMTARSVLRLTPRGARTRGAVLFDGVPVPEPDTPALRTFRSTEIAMIFQDPRAHINPVRSIGDFLTEGLVNARGVPRKPAEAKVVGLLREVGIADAERRMRQHPHELSGGLLQRVMIAAALAAEPKLLLADEPTTALDVTTQAEVMAIIDEARAERGLAMLFITHDLELAAAVCDRVAVMYAGLLVEELPADALHGRSAHPYTRALLASRPGIGERGATLRAIPGRPLSAFEVDAGCAFAPRCPQAQEICHSRQPSRELAGEGSAACLFPVTEDSNV
ncbi:ABC transporter ATP-binding protein [Streptomyces sp. NBC_01618]|uniref:ABC transporter ATP-binding protein n=1 Tax=Streptomyces sp. NBC_01618 TaxID=2975900 RepID=UPI0038655747|nr:ABC transporter ATP-binding protein [Streptomyces sp. NBC_01618]